MLARRAILGATAAVFAPPGPRPRGVRVPSTQRPEASRVARMNSAVPSSSVCEAAATQRPSRQVSSPRSR